MRKFGFLEKYFLYLFNFLSSDYEVEFSVPEYWDCVVIFSLDLELNRLYRFIYCHLFLYH